MKLILMCVLILVATELSLHILLIKLNKRFPLIITGKDRIPKLNKEKLKKFLKTGYDPELGWVRKPNTSKTEIFFWGSKSYHINSIGSRVNPNHEKLKIKVMTFGDSLTFCRAVNDNETWEYHLANLIKCNVTNFGVGNYGIDQALLRFKREVKKHKDTKFVVIGAVPETIERIGAIWKHYCEFGNTFGFKPKFILKKGKLKLIPNPVNTKEKFNNLKEIIPEVNKYDFFYDSFRKNLFTFPYTICILKSPRKVQTIFFHSAIYFMELLKINWRKIKFIPSGKIKKDFYGAAEKRRGYYEDKSLTDLFIAILKEFSIVAKENNLLIAFMLTPQVEELSYITEKGEIYYRKFMDEAKKVIPCIDLLSRFIQLEEPLSIFTSKKYSESYIVHEGHYNNKGNKIVAEEINKFIKENKVIPKPAGRRLTE